jgi:predicted MFS family arabinose efflux permease
MTQPFAATPVRSLWRLPAVILACGTVILILSVGIRQSFGLFMAPMSSAHGWGREVFALALATQNLVWGLSQPFVGAVADKWGSGKVVAVAGLMYAFGLYLMAHAATPADVLISNGLMIGLALSGCGYPVVLAVIGRTVPANRRALFIGIASTGGSSGQLAVIPMSQAVISSHDWLTALVVLGALSALIVPLAAAMTGKGQARAADSIDQSLGEALGEARAHRGYVLLTLGFFVCGWQIGFVAAHLPAYLADHAVSASIAATALATIGLFNILGTFTAGLLGARMRQKHVLAGIYFLRAMVFVVFILLPKTVPVVMGFAAAVGFLWLATVPLTSGLVAHFFGVRYMAMLYGIVFMSHQIGSFCGVWLGGLLFDRTGSYDAIWWGSVVLGLAAAALHVVIRDEPVPRVVAARAAG